ncbi:uncharacterized protein LOC143450091 [Clavelina lepadiformis]|uniref:uncharacterized protein LOC143450091 n=1 Tax=Clavelina lepadiformis TaxID=159417 RepID=UPI0040416AD1
MPANTSTDKPMLGGCCVCLDERGWAENPLVYCDGHGCTIAVHQACYGIVTVPSGPWYCSRCEVHKNSSVKLQCVLCPHQDGAMKKTDNGKWAHVVCALYIPEVEFGNVSSMEPIVLEKIPDERYNRICYVCEEKNSPRKSFGACMNCAKSGCKQNFHVTCAQMSGLLCEEAGGSNTTKYCGYCSQHFSKHKKANPFKSLACSQVYKLPTSSSGTLIDVLPEQADQNLKSNKTVESVYVTKVESVENQIQSINSTTLEACERKSSEEVSTETLKAVDTPTTISSITPLPVLGTTLPSQVEECTSHAIQQGGEVVLPDIKKDAKLKQVIQKEDVIKKKRKTLKNPAEPGAKKVSKPRKSNKPNVNSIAGQQKMETLKPASADTILHETRYAVAPKHSVISLSSFGTSSVEPSDHTDVGSTKPTPTGQTLEHDGLTAIEHLMDQQSTDLMQFFQEFGTSTPVASLLKMLHTLREENTQLESSVEKMTHRRDQLLAIKARLSVPLMSSQYSTINRPQPETSIADSKPFNPTSQSQQHAAPYPYYTNESSQ